MLLDEFVNSKTYKGIAKNVCRNHELMEDLHAETIIVIHEKGFDLSAITNPIYFFSAICWRTWHSNKFRKKYFSKLLIESRLGFDEKLDDDNESIRSHPSLSDYAEETEFEFPDIQVIIDFINSNPINEIDYYEKNLLRLYLELGGSKAVSRKTKIPYRTVANDIRQIKQRFIKQHNEEISYSMQAAPYRAELSPTDRTIHENIRPPRVPG